MSDLLINASSQAAVVTSFYEDQLTQTPSVAAAYVTQTKPLLKVGYTSQTITQNLTDYNTFPNNNTISRTLGSKDPIKTLIEECIPCLERTLSLGDINPFEEMLEMIQAEIDKRWGYLDGMWSMLSNRNLDLCDILNYLGGVCIPDLYAILALLNYHWLQLMMAMKIKIWNLLWSLIQPLLQGLCGSLENMFTKYIRLIIAPIECIISSIDFEYTKLYNITHVGFNKDRGFSVNKPYDHTFRSWAREQVTKPLASTYGWGLGRLRKMLADARDYVNAQIKRLRDAIREILGVDSSAMDDSYGLFAALREVAFVIGLVKAMIKFKEAGFECTDGLTTTQMVPFTYYASDSIGIPISPIDTTASTSTALPDNPADWPATPPPIIPPSSSTTETSETSEASSSPTFTLPDCLAVKDALTQAKLAAWTAELDDIVD